MPADIALDANYMTELRRRESLMGEPSQSPKDFIDETILEAQNPIPEGAPKPSEASELRQSCLDAKQQGSPQ